MSLTTGNQRNRLNEGVNNVTDRRQACTQTRALHRGGRFATCNGNAKAVRAFPGITKSTDAFKTIFSCCTFLAAGHVTRLEHYRRGRHVLLGAVVDQQVQTRLTTLLGVLSTVPLFWRLHVTSRKPPEGQQHGLGRGWAKSFMQRMGFVMRNATKTAKKALQ